MTPRTHIQVAFLKHIIIVAFIIDTTTTIRVVFAWILNTFCVPGRLQKTLRTEMRRQAQVQMSSSPKKLANVTITTSNITR
jgi:hypothetical protein